MIKTFSVKNFRNVMIDEIPLAKINLIVGPNNSGKSNLLKAMGFASELLLAEKSKDESAFYQVMGDHGWDEMLRRGVHERDRSIDLTWEIANEGYKMLYKISFHVSGADHIPVGCYILEETASMYDDDTFAYLVENGILSSSAKYQNKKNGKGAGGDFAAHDRDSIFQQEHDLLKQEKFRVELYPLYQEVSGSLKDYFFVQKGYSCASFSHQRVTEPIGITLHQNHLEEDASNLVNVLGYLDDKYNFLDDYTERLQELIPNLKRLKLIHITESKRQLQLVIDSKTYKLSEMSRGTIQAMILTLLLWTPERMSILSLDEPEVNLHPAWLKLIAEWTTRSTSAQQYFISTHSPDFLDRFTELYRQGEVALLVCNLDGEQTVTRIMPDKLDSFFEEGWELGDLYRVGEPQLGGWPW
ncbi:putative ATPase [Tumebacillus sp. BK434]|uniref:AAA family ATPase n=1 Tax=Tumebacillus sp. BK434 TaxID=2512169 RepID=UPI001042A7F6|nr:AAA family ATPase [Tumebacillus sp. BK434]TCP57724.1 putative ATPase [Tumebacillus sp. BK434]